MIQSADRGSTGSHRAGYKRQSTGNQSSKRLPITSRVSANVAEKLLNLPKRHTGTHVRSAEQRPPRARPRCPRSRDAAAAFRVTFHRRAGARTGKRLSVRPASRVSFFFSPLSFRAEEGGSEERKRNLKNGNKSQGASKTNRQTNKQRRRKRRSPA